MKVFIGILALLLAFLVSCASSAPNLVDSKPREDDQRERENVELHNSAFDSTRVRMTVVRAETTRLKSPQTSFSGELSRHFLAFFHFFAFFATFSCCFSLCLMVPCLFSIISHIFVVFPIFLLLHVFFFLSRFSRSLLSFDPFSMRDRFLTLILNFLAGVVRVPHALSEATCPPLFNGLVCNPGDCCDSYVQVLCGKLRLPALFAS